MGSHSPAAATSLRGHTMWAVSALSHSRLSSRCILHIPCPVSAFHLVGTVRCCCVQQIELGYRIKVVSSQPPVLLTMPDSGKGEESAIRENSVDIVVKSDQSLFFASCPNCPGPNRTPTLHADQCMSVGSTQGGKATDGDVDNKLMNAASSSSAPAENQDKSSVCIYPLCTFREFHGIKLEESAREDSSVIGGVIGVPADGTASARLAEVAAPESLNPGSDVLLGKRKAGATKDGPESKTNRKVATIETYNDSELDWKNRKQTIFRDLPGASGRLGPCMQILAESWDAPELTGIQPLDAPERAPVYIPTFATVQTAAFLCDFSSPAGGIIPFMDERIIYDPDRVGLERLNILSRANGGEPIFLDH